MAVSLYCSPGLPHLLLLQRGLISFAFLVRGQARVDPHIRNVIGTFHQPLPYSGRTSCAVFHQGPIGIQFSCSLRPEGGAGEAEVKQT